VRSSGRVALGGAGDEVKPSSTWSVPELGLDQHRQRTPLPDGRLTLVQQLGQLLQQRVAAPQRLPESRHGIALVVVAVGGGMVAPFTSPYTTLRFAAAATLKKHAVLHVREGIACRRLMHQLRRDDALERRRHVDPIRGGACQLQRLVNERTKRVCERVRASARANANACRPTVNESTSQRVNTPCCSDPPRPSASQPEARNRPSPFEHARTSAWFSTPRPPC